MPQFQGSLGPIQDLQPKRPPAAGNPHLEAWLSMKRAKPRARPSFAWEHAPEILVVATIAIVLIVAGLAR